MKTRFILGSALAAVLLMWGGTGKVMAQKNIDKMAAELEKRDDVAINSVTKRDPKTRKVVKVVKSFSESTFKLFFPICSFKMLLFKSFIQFSLLYKEGKKH